MVSNSDRESGSHYSYALRYKWLTKVYDPVVKWTCREKTFKEALLAEAAIQPSHSVLDLGCGTGTLTIMVKKAVPGAQVTGLDGSPDILELAREKSRAENAQIDYVHGMSFAMPFDDSSFDRVVSSFLFHHLTRADKGPTLSEVVRVLKPGGELHIADWGQQPNLPMKAAFNVVRLLDGFEMTADNIKGEIPVLMAASGLEDVREPQRIMTGLGSVSLYRGTKRSDPS